MTLAALRSLRASAIRTAGTPSIHVHGLCTSRRETCLAERFHARKLVKMCPQPSNLALHSSSLVKPNSFSPMNRQISQLPPAHTTLQVRHCDFDRLTHLSFKAIQLLLSVHVHAECSHPSCCKKKNKIIIIDQHCFDKYYMEQRSRNCTGSPCQVLYPSPAKMHPHQS